MIKIMYKVSVVRGIIFVTLMSHDNRLNVDSPIILLIAKPRSFSAWKFLNVIRKETIPIISINISHTSTCCMSLLYEFNHF